MFRLLRSALMEGQYSLLIMCACVVLGLSWWSTTSKETMRWTSSHTYVRVPPSFTSQMARRGVILTTPSLIIPFTYVMMEAEKYRSPYGTSYVACRLRYS